MPLDRAGGRGHDQCREWVNAEKGTWTLPPARLGRPGLRRSPMVDYPAGYAGISQDQSKALFSHVMWLVALTAGFFALGCYAGRSLSIGWSIAGFIVGLGCVLALNLTARKSGGLSVTLLIAMGLFLGVAMGPAVAYYSGSSPSALWRAAGATALFMAGFGAYGYATRRDLTAVGRVAFFGLIG